MNESSQTGGHANESFRFVQLSDLHLSSIGAPNPLRLLNKRVLGYLSWLRRRRHSHQRWVLDLAAKTLRDLSVDHYAITGDLTHIGLKNEFRQANVWLERLGSPENITVIPGNHDLYVNEKWSNSFKLWESYLYGDHTNSHGDNEHADALTQLNQLYPIVRIRKNVAFIGINSIFDAPWFRATGKIDTHVLSRLKTLLSNRELDNYCKVLLIHHPITLTHTPARKSLLNYQALLEILKSYPVNLILHGHGHHSCFEALKCNNNINIPVFGMSSSSSISQKQDYQAEFLLFNVTQKIQHWEIEKQSYQLDINLMRFIASQEQKLFIPHSFA